MIWSPVAWKTRMPPPTRTFPAGQPAVAGVWEAARFVTVCVTAATCTETAAASAGVACATHGIETVSNIATMARLTDAIARPMQPLLGGYVAPSCALSREYYLEEC